MAKHTVTLIPGDGIGPELTRAMTRVVEATGVDIVWEIAEAGADHIDTYGTPLPASTLDSIRKNKVAIKGP
ncbi:MAG: isocitrate/isopropylmalate family dehydrogenase, partial [Actinomycetota bacterium]|nr:isocitrate/isopropylmalate family dehydrogenase [Actinomycetota bacterium]